MKVLKNKLTGRLIDTRFNEDCEILIKSAKQYGFLDEEIEIIDITEQQYIELIKKQDLTYKERRKKEYNDIGKQLDMIYWDKINGTNLWESFITEIKNRIPKE